MENDEINNFKKKIIFGLLVYEGKDYDHAK